MDAYKDYVKRGKEYAVETFSQLIKEYQIDLDHGPLWKDRTSGGKLCDPGPTNPYHILKFTLKTGPDKNYCITFHYDEFNFSDGDLFKKKKIHEKIQRYFESIETE